MAGLQKYLFCSISGEKAGEEARMEALSSASPAGSVFEVPIWGLLWGTQEVGVHPSSLCPASWGLGVALQGSDGNEPGDVRL